MNIPTIQYSKYCPNPNSTVWRRLLTLTSHLHESVGIENQMPPKPWGSTSDGPAQRVPWMVNAERYSVSGDHSLLAQASR
ncbi:Uncharacterized protein HZ326_5688 [Fusarium oxysporum f. sp. albedinis]|nr:Uncharacterized protein HZ326_5688 [Fusarium oxysporum f. sp. albedinis]